jgi:hypothetical protein
MTDLTLYDYAASPNCLKARVLLAQLGRPTTPRLPFPSVTRPP